MLALGSTLTQPVVGRLRDAGRLATHVGAVWGLTAAAVGIGLLAVVPHPVTLFVAAALIGAMVGVVTPLAFAHLAATTPPERMGRTMGNAEMGRELGDAGGPLLVGAVATATALPVALAATSLVVGGIAWRSLGTPTPPRR